MAYVEDGNPWKDDSLPGRDRAADTLSDKAHHDYLNSINEVEDYEAFLRASASSFSNLILTGILRDQMGFDGVIMTDSLTMAAVRDRLRRRARAGAGTQGRCRHPGQSPNLPRAYRAVLAAVESAELSEERIDESVARILRLKEQLGLLGDPMVDVDAATETLANQAVAQAVGDASVTVLRLRPGGRMPVTEAWSVLLTGWDDAGVRTLEDEPRAGGWTVEATWTGDAPTEREIAKATKAQRRHVITVVVTAYLGADRRQRQLVRRLLKGGRTIIVSPLSL